MTAEIKTAGPCACGRFQDFPAALPPLADGTLHLPVMPVPATCEVLALGIERARLEEALRAAASCGHAGTDQACLECRACDRFDLDGSTAALQRAEGMLEELRATVARLEASHADEVAQATAKLRAEREALFEALVGLVEWGARGHRPHDLAPWIRATQILKDVREASRAEEHAA